MIIVTVTGDCGNERVDSLVSRAPINGILRIGRVEIMQQINDSLLRDDTVVEETARLRLQEWRLSMVRVAVIA